MRPFCLPRTSAEISGKTKKLFLQASYPKVLQTPKKDAPVPAAAPPPRAADTQARPSETAHPGNPLLCSLFRAGGGRPRLRANKQAELVFQANLSLVAAELQERSAVPGDPERAAQLDPALFNSRSVCEPADPLPARSFLFLPFELAGLSQKPQPPGDSSGLLPAEGPSEAAARLQAAEKDRYPMQQLSRLVSGLGSKPVPKRTARFEHQLDQTRLSSFSRNSICSLLDSSEPRALTCHHSEDPPGFYPAPNGPVYYTSVLSEHAGIFYTAS